MATYPIKEVLQRYETEWFTTEQAMGHCLQHIEALTQQQTEAAKSRTEFKKQLASQATEIKALQAELKKVREQLTRLTPIQAKLGELNLAVHDLQKDVNQLTTDN